MLTPTTYHGIGRVLCTSSGGELQLLLNLYSMQAY